MPKHFRLKKSDNDTRWYVDDVNQLGIYCIGDPLDLETVALFARMDWLLKEETKDNLPELEKFEETALLLAVMIQPSLRDDAKSWLSKNFLEALVKEGVYQTVARRCILSIENHQTVDGHMFLYVYRALQ